MKKILKQLLLIMLICLFCISFLGCGNRPIDNLQLQDNSQSEDSSNLQTDVDNEKTTSEVETAEPTPEPEEYYGIPTNMFKSTAERKVDFVLTHTPSGKVLDFSEGHSLTDLGYDFPKVMVSETEELPDPALAPNELAMRFKYTNTDFNTFAFSAVNETDSEQTFDDSRIVFVRYGGDDEWSFCGIHSKMSRDEMVAVLGEPTQESQSAWGYSMEWYFLQEGHTYVINVIKDEDAEQAERITINVDNHPAYGVPVNKADEPVLDGTEMDDNEVDIQDMETSESATITSETPIEDETTEQPADTDAAE